MKHEQPFGALWLVGHRALRNVPSVAAVWNFVRESTSTGVATYPSRPT